MDLQVLVVGGGIHGVGVLHDLASRGVRGLRLVERQRLASGTSSRTTKLLHGGLRYLEHVRQWGLVREALGERTVLLDLWKGLVRPLPIVLPCPKGGRPPWLVHTGLWLYDRLGGVSNLPAARRLVPAEVRELAPYLPAAAVEGLAAAFLYHDVQMKDDALVRLVAAAAARLGASVSEETSADAVMPVPGGFRVDLQGPAGRETLTTRAVVNAAGPWCTANLLKWGFTPSVVSVLNVGSHLLFRRELTPADPDRSAGTLHQNEDGRVVFFLPWFGRWLLGTTESVLTGDPGLVRVPEEDRDYLLRVARSLLGADVGREQVAEAFAGVRVMPVGRKVPRSVPEAWRLDPFSSSPFYLRVYPGDLSAVSRETVLDERAPALLSLYGGKYSTYRSLSERIGDLLAPRLGIRATSRTRDPKCWFLREILEQSPHILDSDASLRLS